MRILSWILLIVGIALAGLGGARNGEALSAVFAHQAPADELGGAAAALDSAYRDHAAALDAVRAARASGEAEALEAAEAHADQALAQIEAARARITALEQAGLFDGPLATALPRLRAAVPEGPAPGARLLDWLIAGGPWWGSGVLLVAVGAFMARRAQKQASTAPDAAGGQADFPGTVRRVLEALDAVTLEIAELPMDGPSAEVREELDRIQDELLTPLVDARGQLVARHGTQAFAVYFGAFSAGERNMARVWSALTDGHSVVARESLERARIEFREALKAWEAAEAAL